MNMKRNKRKHANRKLRDMKNFEEREDRKLAGGMKGRAQKDEPYWANEDWSLTDESAED